MGIFDSAKDKATEFAGDNGDKVDQGVEKVGDQVDQRTDGKYSDQVDKGQDFANEKLDDQFGGQ